MHWTIQPLDFFLNFYLVYKNQQKKKKTIEERAHKQQHINTTTKKEEIFMFTRIENRIWMEKNSWLLFGLPWKYINSWFRPLFWTTLHIQLCSNNKFIATTKKEITVFFLLFCSLILRLFVVYSKIMDFIRIHQFWKKNNSALHELQM